MTREWRRKLGFWRRNFVNAIFGVKVIEGGRGCSPEDEQTYPYLLEVNFSPPEFMQVAFVLMYGGRETVYAIGRSEAALEFFAARYGFRKHPRFLDLTITKATPSASTA